MIGVLSRVNRIRRTVLACVVFWAQIVRATPCGNAVKTKEVLKLVQICIVHCMLMEGAASLLSLVLIDSLPHPQSTGHSAVPTGSW